jgi:hypothetical protein
MADQQLRLHDLLMQVSAHLGQEQAMHADTESWHQALLAAPERQRAVVHGTVDDTSFLVSSATPLGGIPGIPFFWLPPWAGRPGGAAPAPGAPGAPDGDVDANRRPA